MRPRLGLPVPLLAFWLVVLTTPAHSASLNELLAQGHLSVNTSIHPEEPVVPGQKAELVIEIGTDTWFTGGTRIAPPEVAGLVILQNEQFAANATETRDGKTWVIQRWTLDVFAQRAGKFSIPPLRLKLEVNAGAGGSAAGELYTAATLFESVLPQTLETIEGWVAAPRFSVQQQFDRSLDNLTAGDAFEREIAFEASDVMAMMLPEADTPSLDGLAAYPKPPKLDNSNNRGETLAKRVQRVSFVAEQPGEYELPAQEFYWWNTDSAALEVIELPAVSVTVTGAAARDESRAPSAITKGQLLRAGALLGVLVLTVVVARLLLKHLPWRRAIAVLRSALQQLAALRKPALPERLNPGSNAGD